MPGLPRITGRELIKALQKAGFEVSRQKGSHVQMIKWFGDQKTTFPVPVHAGKVLKPGTLKGILRLAGIAPEKLYELLSQ